MIRTPIASAFLVIAGAAAQAAEIKVVSALAFVTDPEVAPVIKTKCLSPD